MFTGDLGKRDTLDKLSFVLLHWNNRVGVSWSETVLQSYKGFVAFLYQNMLLYWLGCYRLKFLKAVAFCNISPDTINCIRLEKNNAKPYELVDTNRDNLNI